MAKQNKRKKQKKHKQEIRIIFRDGKEDVIPQKYWTNYEVFAKAGCMYLHVIKNKQWIAGYNLADVVSWTVG